MKGPTVRFPFRQMWDIHWGCSFMSFFIFIFYVSTKGLLDDFNPPIPSFKGKRCPEPNHIK